jgi:ABC-2 type transport system ATP-binding protein
VKALETHNLRKEFGTLVAVDDLNLSVEPGQVLGLIGPNGAGKTTLLRMLATLLRQTDGTASILGHDIRRDYLEIRKHLGFLPDFFGLYSDLTLAECLAFFARAYGVPAGEIPTRVNAALDHTELQAKRDAFVRHLSRGMVQRLGVGALMVHDPRLYLLDEPASGLDPKARIQLRNVLRRLSSEGRSVVISSHILTELSGFCTHIAIMDRGRLVVHGEVDQIQRELAGARRVTITVLDRVDTAATIIKAFPDTELISVENTTLTADMKTGLEALAGLNARLVNEGVPVIGFAEAQADLEDLFMQISGQDDAPPETTS